MLKLKTKKLLTIFTKSSIICVWQDLDTSLWFRLLQKADRKFYYESHHYQLNPEIPTWKKNNVSFYIFSSLQKWIEHLMIEWQENLACPSLELLEILHKMHFQVQNRSSFVSPSTLSNMFLMRAYNLFVPIKALIN